MNYKIITAIFVLIASVGISFNNTATLRPVRNFSTIILLKNLNGLTQRVDRGISALEIIHRLNQLETENINLKNQVAQLNSNLITLKELSHENVLLKQEIGIRNQLGSQFQLASVIGRSISGARADILIDKGSDDGVKTDQAALSNGYLVGKVVAVLPHSSRVATILNHNLNITVTLQDSRALGLMHGGLEGLVVEQIPVDVAVKTGEAIVTSGVAGEVPRGIPVGKVNTIISKKADIFHTVTVNSPINFNDLELVSIQLKTQ